MVHAPASISMLLHVHAILHAAPAGVASNDVLFWAGVLIVLVLAGAVAVMMVRRRLLQGESSVDASEGLLDSMRRLRDSGEMSAAEFEAARKSMAERISASMTKRAADRDAKLNASTNAKRSSR
jgi:hypothetical protein